MKLRYLHLIHRWLGIGLGLFVLLWFLSGLVMLFVAYPQLTQAERLNRLDSLQLQQVKLSAAQAWVLTGKQGQPESIRLAMRGHRPTYYFLQHGQWLAIWADANNVAPNVAPGESIPDESIQVSKAEAINAAEQYQGQAKATEALLLDHDQWSISSSLNGHRPLYRVALDDADATELYVSSHTGEVVLDTQGAERAWNWLGSVIHWVYFTPLRMERELWRQVVLWLAFAGVALASLGLWLGVQRIRINRRYSNDRVTPYRGWARWHHIVGLSAGVFCITWLFSGWLSLTPFGWFSDRSLRAEEAEHWAGGTPNVQDMRLPVSAFATRLTGTDIKEIEWLKFAGNTYILAKAAEQESLVDRQSGVPVAGFSAAILQAQAAKLALHAQITSAHWLTSGDLYFNQDAQKTPRVLRVAFADALNTTFYIDARTSKILASQDSYSRTYRWLFNGLHRIDIPPLGDRLLARRITIFVLSAGGVLLTLAGIVLGWRRVRRKWPQRVAAGNR